MRIINNLLFNNVRNSKTDTQKLKNFKFYTIIKPSVLSNMLNANYPGESTETLLFIAS